MKEINIHIADDHQVLIDGLCAVLGIEDNFKIVGTSLNGKEVIAWYEDNKSDVLILDINMPDVDGIEVLKAFGKKSSADLPAIIILTTYDDIKLIKEVLKMGVTGFLSKSCAGEHITEAINAVAKGEQYFSPTINEKIVKSFTGVAAAEINKNADQSLINCLTGRELDVLKLIAQEYTSKEISKILFISTNTVETHRKNLIKKLNVKSSLGLAKFALLNDIIEK